MPRGISVKAPAGSKWCPRCGVIKPLSAFNWSESYCGPCKQNYRRQKRIEKAGKPDPTIAARFWPKVNKHGPVFKDLGRCWLWTGAKSNRGYGSISYQGADHPAHRVSLEMVGIHATYPAQVVDHICKRIACVNPKHLRVVTQADNVGKYSKGTPHWINKNLTHCQHGHAFAGKNLAVKRITPAPKKGRKPYFTRICLTCLPHYWHYALIERRGPPLARVKWRGPPKEWLDKNSQSAQGSDIA